MQLKSQKLLFDIATAAGKIEQFVAEKSWQDYQHDDLLRSGVERQFEIIGEALNQLSKIDSETVQEIRKYQQIISFRNLLIHGYASVDDRLVWDVIETTLPELVEDIRRL